jgi:PAS domain S-box-containing protein
MGVLYLEKRPGGGRTTARRLTKRGFEVRTSPLGSFGPETLAGSPPALVVCDLESARDLASLETVRKLAPEVPVLVISAKRAASLSERAKGLGVQRFLVRPVRASDLEVALHQALQQLAGDDLERLEFANRQLSALNQVSNVFSTLREEDELLDAVPKLLTESLAFDRGIVLLHDGASLFVRSVCFAKDPPEYIERFLRRVRSGELPVPPPFVESYERNVPIFIPDPNADPRWPRAPGEVIRTRSMVIAPIRSQNHPIGILMGNMQHQERAMDAQDVARFEMFANMVGLALDNIRAYQRLERKVEERTESLRAANQDLQAILESFEKERNFASAVLDTAPALVLVLDSEGRVVRFNRACEHLSGYRFDEIRGKRFADEFLLPEERSEVERDFGKLVAGETRLERQNYWRTRTGEKRLIEWSNTVLPGDDGGVEYVVSTGIDITDRHQTQKKLRLYRQIYDRSYDGTVILDQNGVFVERNPIHRVLSGFSDADLIGRSAAEFFGEERVASVLATVRTAGIYRGELDVPNANGTFTPVEVSVFSILDDAGEILYFVAIGRDITERKRAEEALRRAHDELEARVNARTLELAQLNETLLKEVAERKQAEEALRRSHELLSKQNAVLADFSKRLTPESGNVESLMAELTAAAAANLKVARVSVWMYGDGESFIECTSLYDLVSDRHERGQRLAKSDYPRYFEALAEHRAIAAHDAHADPRTSEFSRSYLTPLGITSMLDAPIWLEGRMVGVVCNEHVGPARTWTPEEERFVASIADFASLTLEAHQRFRAEQDLRKAHDELEDRVEQRTGQLARMNVAYRDEIHERRQAQEALAVRLRYEEGLAACSKTLLTESDPASAVPEALRHLLAASEASRVYLSENSDDPVEGLTVVPVYEISAGGLDESPTRPPGIPYHRLPRWRVELSAGRWVGGVVSSLPEEERKLLAEFHVQSILALPLFVDGAWQGLLGFLDLEQEREWSREDVRSLETAAEMVGVYLGHKRASDRLRLTVEDLARANRELRETQSQLVQSEKMASLGSLVAGIAHEINTPVGAISSMHDTLVRALRKLEGTLNEEHPGIVGASPSLQSALALVQEANRVIESATQRVTEIVRRLRSFARLDQAELKKADIHEGLEDTLALVHHELKHNIVVKREYGKIPLIACYPGRLNQVFLNLLNNARQAIRGKGEILLRTFLQDDHVHIEVRDSGTGIAPEHLRKIFDPGFTTKGVGVGTGLGLSICYQIVQDHRGEIRVESEPGKGSTFTVILPTNLDQLGPLVGTAAANVA